MPNLIGSARIDAGAMKSRNNASDTWTCHCQRRGLEPQHTGVLDKKRPGDYPSPLRYLVEGRRLVLNQPSKLQGNAGYQSGKIWVIATIKIPPLSDGVRLIP